MNSQMWSAFCEETALIKQAELLEKDAALGAVKNFLGGGMVALQGLGNVARQGFQQKGLSGAWKGVKGAVQSSAADPTRSKALLGAGTILGGGALGAYGAKKAVMG